MVIISVSGLKNSGKDTFADVLVDRHGFKKISLADPLRELCSKIFGIDMKYFLDRDKKDTDLPFNLMIEFDHIDRIVKQVEDWGFVVTNEARAELDEFHGTYIDTPRDLLKCVGTNMLRQNVRDDLWLVITLTKIKELGQKVVVADVRFDNERKMFDNIGATMVLIKRPDVEEEDHHISENTGDDDQYDVIFQNTEKLQVFKSEVDMWYTLRRDSLQKPQFKYTY